MKTTMKINSIVKTLISGITITVLSTIKANALELPKAAVISCDIKETVLAAEQATSLLRMEFEKIQQYEMSDRYEVNNKIKADPDVKQGECFSKSCLVYVGQLLKVDYAISATVESYKSFMNVNIRVINVKEDKIEKTYTADFVNLPEKLQLIFEVAVSEMYQKKLDENLVKSLKQTPDIENAINNPDQTRLNLSGPRFGATFFTGKSAKILMDDENKGGYDLAYPGMFQFGYQFEKQYLNEGNIQGLFEVIPMISGMDQGKIIPSLTLLHGIRSNSQGWEFAFGPTITLSTIASGYYDAEGTWKLKEEWVSADKNPYQIISRMDSRGDYQLNPGFVMAFGKSFKSGKMNIPVNAFIIPSRSGMRIGMSFGFNAKRDAK